MSVLSEAKIELTGTPVNMGNLAAFFWRWYHSHKNDVVFRKTIVIIKVTIRVKDLRELFETLFGRDPIAPQEV